LSFDDSNPDFNSKQKLPFLYKNPFSIMKNPITLDLTTCTFKVENNDNQTVAEVSDIQGKKLIPFVTIFEISA